jgi:AhpD family alkylhydroperoxidase
MARLAPVEAKAFFTFDHAVKRADGKIPPKVREMIALAVAMTTQCGYCLQVHGEAARRLGVTREELAEVATIAAAVRAGAVLAWAACAAFVRRRGLAALRQKGGQRRRSQHQGVVGLTATTCLARPTDFSGSRWVHWLSTGNSCISAVSPHIFSELPVPWHSLGPLRMRFLSSIEGELDGLAFCSTTQPRAVE